mgnify:CR=1 FL=1
MNQAKRLAAIAALALPSLALPSLAHAAGAAGAAPAAPITPYADARYRIEVVDQAGLPETAAAATLRVRAGLRSAEWNGLSGVVEGEVIAALGKARYNDTINGRVSFPIVADPSDALLNQAYLRWRPSAAVDLSAGRQAINIDNQRWVGSVNWRQNDQTFDAVRASVKPAKAFSLDYFYAWRVNRVFGTDSPQGIWRHTAIHSARAAYVVPGLGTLSAYGLWLDIPSAPASSSRTLGARLAGEYKLGPATRLLYSAEYARQKNAANNPASYDLSYLLIEPGVASGPWSARVGFERLEGNGTAAVQTPLATLHAFNGWADKFLTTPARGLRDLYVDAGWKAAKGPLKGLGLRAAWHDYNSTVGGLNYGQEWNAQASYPLGRNWTVLTKLARYNAQTLATDTTKFWFLVEARF